ncbi:hypothetical protein KM043_007898 [Ampulex compressa]|nr:hypothetical protein KM043_007898 [Ampulex compressa]
MGKKGCNNLSPKRLRNFYVGIQNTDSSRLHWYLTVRANLVQKTDSRSFRESCSTLLNACSKRYLNRRMINDDDLDKMLICGMCIFNRGPITITTEG